MTRSITNNTITLFVNGDIKVMTSEDKNFPIVVDLVSTGAIWEDVEEYFNVAHSDRIEEKDGEILFDSEVLPPPLVERYYSMLEHGYDVGPLVAFMQRLGKNPSRNSVQQLYNFLEHKNISIDEEGYFWAYKAIRPDWKDIYSGKIDNSIGSVVSMKRALVDEDPNSHCSHGLHVGSIEYVHWYGSSDSIVVICKVDPADVVAVPTDHNAQKLRTCKYEVLQEFKGDVYHLYTQYKKAQGLTEDDIEELEEFVPDWYDEDEY